jgi:hypothetical protein
MPKYKHENFGHVQNHIFAKGVITAVDGENDTADVTVEGYESGSDVPLFYHCEPDSEERGNGAIEGAASAFNEGDEVIVQLEVNGPPVRIVGFVEGIKECLEKGPTLLICCVETDLCVVWDLETNEPSEKVKDEDDELVTSWPVELTTINSWKAKQARACASELFESTYHSKEDCSGPPDWEYKDPAWMENEDSTWERRWYARSAFADEDENDVWASWFATQIFDEEEVGLIYRDIVSTIHTIAGWKVTALNGSEAEESFTVTSDWTKTQFEQHGEEDWRTGLYQDVTDDPYFPSLTETKSVSCDDCWCYVWDVYYGFSFCNGDVPHDPLENVDTIPLILQTQGYYAPGEEDEGSGWIAQTFLRKNILKDECDPDPVYHAYGSVAIDVDPDSDPFTMPESIELTGLLEEMIEPDDPLNPGVTTKQIAMTPYVAARPGDIQMLALHNNHRVATGHSPLKLLECASVQARIHAENITNGTPCGHSGMEDREEFIKDHFEDTVSIGENVACGPPTNAIAFQEWLDSPLHRANIENRLYSYMGYGQSGVNRVVIFVVVD